MKQTTRQTAFTDIVVLFNPNSTGSGEAMAKELQTALPKGAVRLVGTEHAGHAEELAYTYAQDSARPLIISSSGDGGYHEVINGLMRAAGEGHQATAGLLPAGNANDHYHEVHDGDIVAAITANDVRQIDLLHLRTTIDGKPFERYAHSYIGFGLTPQVGAELNKTDLNKLKEIMIVTKSLLTLRPIRVSVAGKRRSYYSMVFSNVSKMSKVLSLTKQANNQDGKYEVSLFRRRNKLALIRSLVKASTTGLTGRSQAKPFTFVTIKPLLVQLDGEIFTVDPGVTVTVSLRPRALRCIV